MFVIFTFPKKDQEKDVPLKLIGEWINKNKWENNISLVFMTGFDAIDKNYLEELKNLGFKIFNKTFKTKKLLENNPLFERLPRFYKFCFLRWLLFYEMVLSKEISLPKVLIGGDVFLTENPKKIFNEIQKNNFILQGCSDFSCINDINWLENFSKETKRFIQEGNKYHIHNRFNLKDSDEKEFLYEKTYPLPLRHDQDLIQFLIAKGKLHQTKSETLYKRSNYFWFQNPIRNYQWMQSQLKSKDSMFKLKNDEIYIENKKIPFIHFQGDFVNFLYLHENLNFLKIKTLRDSLLSFFIKSPNHFFSKLFLKLVVYGSKEEFNRKSVIEKFITLNDKHSYKKLAQVLNYIKEKNRKIKLNIY